MYLARTERAKHPWRLPQLNQEFYSYEGLVSALHGSVDYFFTSIESGQLSQWLRDELDLLDLANDLEACFTKGHVDEGLQLLLEGSDYTQTLALDPLIKAYHTYAKKTSGERYKLQGDQWLKVGRYLEAIKSYKKAMAIEYIPEVGNNLAIAYMAIESYDRAMKALNQCVSQRDQIDYRLNRIRLNLQCLNYEAMLVDLRHISGLHEHKDIWYYYGRAYEGLERVEEAIAAYIKALETTIDQQCLMALIQLAMDHGQDQLMGVWLTAHKDRLKDQQILYIKAQLAKSLEDGDAYIHLMERVVECDHDQVVYIFELIKYYVDHGQIIKALEYMGRIPKKFQSMEQVWYYKIIISNAAGNRKEFRDQVSSLTNKWKKDARRLAAR